MTNSAITKRINLFALMILIVGQTILAPIASAGVVVADEDAKEPANEKTKGQDEALDANKDEDTNKDKSADSGDAAEEKNNEENEGSNEGTTSDERSNENADNVDTKNNSPPAKEGEADGTNDSKEGTEELGETTEEEETGSEDQSDGSIGLFADGEGEPEYKKEIPLDDSHIKDFSFKVNGSEFVEGQTNVRNGDSFELEIDFIEKIEHDDNDMNFGPGTVLKYPLPENFTQHFTGLSVPQNFGTPPNYIGELQIDADNGYVAITLNDNIKEGVTIKAIEQGTFTISGNFSNDNDEWDKEINMPKGENFTVNFVPKQNVGTAIDKSVKANKNGQKSDELHWTVIVNTNRTITDSADDDPVFTDELSSNATGHKYDEGSVKVREIPITPKGVGEPSQQTITPVLGPTFENNGENDTGNPKMNITLEKGKAYEIKYTTIPDNPGINESVTYNNEADYAGNTTNRSTTVQFGKAIEKTASSPNTDLETEWTIKYNYNEQNIPANTTVTDKWTVSGVTGSVDTKQILVGGNDGITIEGVDGGPSLDSNDYSVSYEEDEQKFELTFNKAFDHPINIKYKTKPNDALKVDENFTVENKAEHGHITTSDSKTVEYNTTNLTLKKETVGSLNYESKTMDWKITANQAGYQLKEDDKFVDEFTNENMKLVDNSLTVKFDGDTKTAGTDYELTVDQDGNGFEVKLLTDTKAEVVIEYTTSFDEIKVITDDDREKRYQNKVTLDAQELPNKPSDTAFYNPRDEHKQNGSKDGSYNYETKEFTWTIIFNYNSNTLTNAILKDELPEEHEITEATLEKGHINSSGSFVKADDVTLPADIIGKSEFELELSTIDQPYRLVYKTKMKGDVMPVDGQSNYTVTNKAELYDGNDKNGGWKKDVEVKHSKNVLDQKNGAQVGNTETIKWNFLYNTAQSKLTNVVISDTFVDDENSDIPKNQLINEESLKVYKVTYTGTTPNNPGENKTEIDRSEYDLDFNTDGATFVLGFDKIDYPIYVEYESMFIGLENSPISNELGVTYKDGDDQEGDTRKSITNFTYGAFASTSAGEFVIVKTDEATGEPLPEVEFTLKNRNGKPLLTGTTNEQGVLDFGMKFATGTYHLDEKKLDDYEELKDFKFELTADGGPYEGKQIVNVTNTPDDPDLKMCDDFTVTVKDVNNDPVGDGKTIKLVNEKTGQIFEEKTDGYGKIIKDREDLPAGDYKVYEVDNGEEIFIDELEVRYAGEDNTECNATVQPETINITVTKEWKNDNENNRPDEITVKLFANGKEIDSEKITASNDWTHEFKNLRKLNNAGTEVIKYTVEEEEVEGYRTTYKQPDMNSDSNDLTAVITNRKPSPGGGGGFVPPTPSTCDDFTITVKEDGETVGADVELTIESETTELNVTTHANGQIIIDKIDLDEGTYTVYDKDGNDVGTISVTYKQGECQDEIDIALAPVCDDFTVTISEDGEPVESGDYTFTSKDGETEVTKTVDSNGKVVFDRDELPEGKYTVTDEDNENVGTITVDYSETPCEATINIGETPAPTCDDFTLEIQDRRGNARADVDNITIEDGDGNKVSYENENGETVDTFTTNDKGQIILPFYLEPGVYTVYENDKSINTFRATDTCEATVKPRSTGGGGGGGTPPTPTTCDDFTITVKEDGETVGKDVELTLKSGTTEIDVTTDANGKVVIDKADLPKGSYTAYDKDGNEVGTITVTYEKDKCQDELNLTTAPVCDDFTVTIKEDGKPVTSGKYTFASEDRETIITVTVDEDGKVVFERDDLASGKYTVISEDGKTSSISVDYTKDPCETDVNFSKDSETPTDPEDPKDPEEPETDDPKDPEKPDSEDPDKDDDGSIKGEGDSKDPSDEDDSTVKGDGTGTKGDGDSDETGVKGSEVTVGGEQVGEDGKTLPKTATNIFNLAMIGLTFLVLGFILVYRRERA